MIHKIYYSGSKQKSSGIEAIINVLKSCLDTYSNMGVPISCEFKGVYASVNLKVRDENLVKINNFTHVIMAQVNCKGIMTTAKVFRVGACVSPVHIDFTKLKLKKRQSHIHAKAGPFSQTFLVNKDFDIDPDIVKPSDAVIIYKVTQRKRQLRFIKTVVNLPLEGTEIMYMLNLMSEIKVIGKH